MQPQESLLQDTILVLKQRQGASLAQIRKRLELNNSDGKLDGTKNKMLSSTLKNLVLKGKVEKNGGVYKLARGDPADQENEVPSRRHRAFPYGPSKRHRRYHKLRRRKGHRHRGRRRRHSRRGRAFPHGRGKRQRRYHKLRRRKGHRYRR